MGNPCLLGLLFDGQELSDLEVRELLDQLLDCLFPQFQLLLAHLE